MKEENEGYGEKFAEKEGFRPGMKE